MKSKEQTLAYKRVIKQCFWSPEWSWFFTSDPKVLILFCKKKLKISDRLFCTKNENCLSQIFRNNRNVITTCFFFQRNTIKMQDIVTIESSCTVLASGWLLGDSKYRVHFQTSQDHISGFVETKKIILLTFKIFRVGGQKQHFFHHTEY